MTCQHPTTEPVIPLGSGAPVAEVCVDCFDRLDVGYNCDECEWTVLRNFGGSQVRRIKTEACSEHVEVQRVYFSAEVS